jgi:L-threonylcarbamoyladenylate synthase
LESEKVESAVRGTDEQIERGAEIIRGGGIVALPTETVYGLGANAFDERAVARVFETKRRPFFDPLILHVGGREWLSDLVTGTPALADRLIDAFWPGPLTIVLPKKTAVPDIATAGLPGVAVRIPAHDTALRLINAAGVPIAAPSANPFGYVSPTTAEHVRAQLGAAVDMILDGGACEVGIESTIISFMDGTPTLLRPGGTALEEIEEVIGAVAIPANNELVNQSPGRSEQHYATATPLVLIDSTEFSVPRDNAGLIALAPDGETGNSNAFAVVEYLSADGDLREAACNLFAAMRRLDTCGVDVIFARTVPNTGLGLAINDRLRRAAVKRGAAGAKP